MVGELQLQIWGVNFDLRLHFLISGFQKFLTKLKWEYHLNVLHHLAYHLGWLSTRYLAHMLSIEVDVCSVGVLEVLQYWTLQTSTSFTDKVEPSGILDYVTLCLTSIVVNKHTCICELCVMLTDIMVLMANHPWMGWAICWQSWCYYMHYTLHY